MTQSIVTKVFIGTLAAIGQARARQLHQLTGAPAPAPMPGGADEGSVNPDLFLADVPCLSAIEECIPEPVRPVHKALVMPAPKTMTRAKHVEGGQHMPGCPSGYAATLQLGTPGEDVQEFVGLFDTGSGVTAPYAKNGSLESIDPDTDESVETPLAAPVFTNGPGTELTGNSTFQSYGKGFWAGPEAITDVAIKGWPVVEMGIGEIATLSSMLNGTCDFEGQIPNVQHAIIGMDKATYNPEGLDPYFVKAMPHMADPTFSLGLCDINGTVVQGRPLNKYLASNFVYAAYQSGFYGHGISVTGIRVGEHRLSFDNSDFGQTLVDSGSTAVSMPAPITYAMADAIALQTRNGAWRRLIQTNSCFQLPAGVTREQLDASLPSITLEVTDPEDSKRINTLTFSASNFWLTLLMSKDGSTKACAYVGASNPNATPLTSVLGNIVNVGNWLHFANGVGFAQGKNICEELQ